MHVFNGIACVDGEIKNLPELWFLLGGPNISGNKPAKFPITIRHNNLDYTTESSSVNSTNTFCGTQHYKCEALPSQLPVLSAMFSSQLRYLNLDNSGSVSHCYYFFSLFHRDFSVI